MFFQRRDFDQDFQPVEDGPEKTGPARFWELIKEELAAVLIINFLFIVTCVPIITIPPALLALHMAMQKIIRDEGPLRVHHYFTAFKQNWKRAYGAFLLTFLPMGIAGFGALFYLRRASELPVLLVPFAFCTTIFLITTLASVYLYGLLCDGRPLRAAVKPALLLGVARPLRAVLAALCYYGILLLAVMYFPLSGMYLLLLGFSLPCLLGNFYIRTVLKLYCENSDQA